MRGERESGEGEGRWEREWERKMVEGEVRGGEERCEREVCVCVRERERGEK